MGVYQRGSIWWIRYSHKGKIIRETSGSENKTVAKKLLSIRKAEIAQGKYKIKAPDSQILFQDYAMEFLRWAKIHRKEGAYLRYKFSLNMLLPIFGHQKLNEIKKKDIDNYKTRRKRSVSGATINRDLACLKKLYNNAIADEIVDTNPVNSVEFFKESKKSFRIFTEEQASHLINACDTDATKSFVILGLNLGLRKNELLSLKWEDVNLQDRFIVLRDTKNNNEDTVPLNETALRHLEQLTRNSEYVICKPNGERFWDFRGSWSRILEKAGLPKFTPHDMRHTFATTLVREGADIMAVKELGRWSDLKLVERYAHVAEDHRTRVISKLDGKFSSDNHSDTKGDTVDE